MKYLRKKIDGRSVYFRKDKIDFEIFKAVYLDNEYLLNGFSDQDVVIDVGAHIGSFSLKARSLGARKIYSFEANKDNFKLLQKNAGDVCKVENLAVWRSDVDVPTLNFQHSHDELNSGGGTVDSNGVEVVNAKGLDAIISEILKENDYVEQIALLKLDCEGSEFPILLTSKMIKHVRCIIGEYHLGHVNESLPMTGSFYFERRDLRNSFKKSNFDVSFIRLNESLGYFFAFNKYV